MAQDIIGTEFIKTAAFGIAEAARLLVIFLVIAGFVGAIAYFIIRILQYKHTVVVRSLINNRVIIKKYNAKEYIDKKGILWWKIRGIKDKEKQLMPAPDARCIDIDYKGKKWVEVYELSSGGYITIYDKANIGLIPDDIDTIATATEFKEKDKIKNDYPDSLERDELLYQWKQKVINRWVKENDYDKAFNPFGSLDRQAIVNNIKDAQERKNKGFMEQLPQMIAIGALVMIVICGMIFIPDWFEGRSLTANEFKTVASLQNENLIILRDIKLGIQTITTKQQELEGRVNNIDKNQATLPPD